MATRIERQRAIGWRGIKRVTVINSAARAGARNNNINSISARINICNVIAT